MKSSPLTTKHRLQTIVGLIVVVSVGVVIYFLTQGFNLDIRGRAASGLSKEEVAGRAMLSSAAGCVKLDSTSGECMDIEDGRGGEMNAPISKPLETICSQDISLRVKYLTGSGCRPGITDCNYQPLTAIGWQGNSPSLIKKNNLPIPLTETDKKGKRVWISDAGFSRRDSGLVKGLGITRMGDGRIIISHSNAYSKVKPAKNSLEAINADITVTGGAYVTEFSNGYTGYPEDIVAHDENGKRLRSRVDEPFNNIVTEYPFSDPIKQDELYFDRPNIVRSKHWLHKTRQTYAGDDYVVKLNCSAPPTATPTASVTPTPTTPPSCSSNPVDIVFAIDRSTSLKKTSTVDGVTKSNLEWEKKAIKNVITAVLAKQPEPVRRNIRVAVSSWAGKNTLVDTLPFSTFNASTLSWSPIVPVKYDAVSGWQSVIDTIDAIQFKESDSGTCITCGVKSSGDMIASSSSKRVVILMSDGISNTSLNGKANMPDRVYIPDPYSKITAEEAISIANAYKGKGITYYVVGYGDKNVDGATKIIEENLVKISGTSSSTGGEYYTYAGETSDWDKVFAGIIPKLCPDNSIKQAVEQYINQ